MALSSCTTSPNANNLINEYRDYQNQFFYNPSNDASLAESYYDLINSQHCPALLPAKTLYEISDLIVDAVPNYIGGSDIGPDGIGNMNISLTIKTPIKITKKNKIEKENIVIYSYSYTGDECEYVFSDKDRIFYFIEVNQRLYFLAALEYQDTKF